MLQVSRDSNLKIPKKLEDFNGAANKYYLDTLECLLEANFIRKKYIL